MLWGTKAQFLNLHATRGRQGIIPKTKKLSTCLFAGDCLVNGKPDVRHEVGRSTCRSPDHFAARSDHDRAARELGGWVADLRLSGGIGEPNQVSLGERELLPGRNECVPLRVPA